MSDLTAVQRLWEWQYGKADHFTAMLYRMFQKADMDNLLKLRNAFPDEFEAYREWYHATSPKEFFEKYNLKVDL